MQFPADANEIEILLVQRKDSIGYMEILRGKYKHSEPDYIRNLLSGTTSQERERLVRIPFDTLWEAMWGPPQELGHSYKSEREIARQKFEVLLADLPQFLADLSGTVWSTPEWGIPKGRRELHESEYACAIREFWEETNIKEEDIIPLRNIEPLKELFQGSNGVMYCHKYILAYAPPHVGLSPFSVSAAENVHMQREIGDIRWVPLQDAMTYFRPEHKGRVHILRSLQQILSKIVCISVA